MRSALWKMRSYQRMLVFFLFIIINIIIIFVCCWFNFLNILFIFFCFLTKKYIYNIYSCDSCERLNRIVLGRAFTSDGKVVRTITSRTIKKTFHLWCKSIFIVTNQMIILKTSPVKKSLWIQLKIGKTIRCKQKDNEISSKITQKFIWGRTSYSEIVMK